MGSNDLRAPRFDVSLTVVCDAGDKVFSAPVIDLSESGAFVLTAHQLPVGTPVVLVPDESAEKELPAEMHADVVRVVDSGLQGRADDSSGIAFRFRGLRVHEFAQVRAFLRKRGNIKPPP